MGYSLSEAAAAVGLSKKIVSRAIKDGLISAEMDDRGRYDIDPAELHRVYPAVTHDPSITDRRAHTDVAERATSPRPASPWWRRLVGR